LDTCLSGLFVIKNCKV